jgi:hypothetical protein
VRLLRTIAVLLSLSGCAALSAAMPILADIVAAVTDAMQIVDTIERFVDAYFLAHPDEVKELQVKRAIAKTRSSLNLALRSSRGAQELNQQKVDEAFAEFKGAYRELLLLVGPLGVRPSGALAATPIDDRLYVPEPVAMHMKVRE